jgi:ribosomal protein S18 acetylase RimI-like enzyme
MISDHSGPISDDSRLDKMVGMASKLTIVPARPEDLAAAFRLLFERLPEEDREARVANALFLVERGELPREGVFVAPERDDILGALVCVPLKGASGLLWPPRVLDGPARRQVEDALVQRACAWLRTRGAKLAQALLAPEEACLAAPLVRNGFVRVTSLHYMRHDMDQEVAGFATDIACRHAGAACLEYTIYGAVDVSRFEQTLLRTYDDTLDCPELNGVRELREIIEGHQAQGVHDPERWWLAEEAGQACGVLLVADIPDLSAWDLSYVGVVPEARGRGIGRALVCKALVEAHAAGVSRMTLAVDSRNQPARRLYRNLGFRVTEQREVYLAFFRQR